MSAVFPKFRWHDRRWPLSLARLFISSTIRRYERSVLHSTVQAREVSSVKKQSSLSLFASSSDKLWLHEATWIQALNTAYKFYLHSGLMLVIGRITEHGSDLISIVVDNFHFVIISALLVSSFILLCHELGFMKITFDWTRAAFLSGEKLTLLLQCSRDATWSHQWLSIA